jgi:hypothetical protein
MTDQKPKSSVLATIAYFAFFALLSAWIVLQPQFTWDLVGYIGTAVDSSDPVTIHKITFAAIKPVSSGAEIQVDNPYRVDVAANPYHFAEQLPFYSIKPVYVELIKVIHHAGMPFPRAAILISAASNFALAAILWFWLGSYVGGWAQAGACGLIMLSPNILALARWATPDCLATAVAAFALCLILERKKYFWGCGLLVVNIWIRTDALVLAGIVFAALLLCRKIDVVEFASLSVLALASFFTINHFSGTYGWVALFYNSFLGGLVDPGEHVLDFSRSAYIHQLIRGSFVWLIYGGFALYVLLGGLAIWLGRNAMYAYVVVAVLAARVVSYFLYPNGDQRYTAVLYVVVLVSLIIGVRQRRLGAQPQSWLSRFAISPSAESERTTA